MFGVLTVTILVLLLGVWDVWGTNSNNTSAIIIRIINTSTNFSANAGTNTSAVPRNPRAVPCQT